MANDRFADIAASYSVDTERGLIFPCPPELPQIQIPLAGGAEGVFTPYKKMDTKAELYAALAEKRKEYAPYLRDLAPKMESKVYHVDVEEFMWSFEGAEPEKLTIPHYGAEGGKHTAVYESTFTLPAFDANKKRVVITFRGVDYIANVFVNGEYAGSHEGFFAPFEFDITDIAKEGENSLRVVVKNDFTMTGNACANGMSADGDKIYAATGPGWDEPEIGWHHCPAGMGIFQKVFVEIRENEYLTDLFVRNGNELWIECMGTSIVEKPVHFLVSVYGQNFEETVFENMEFHPTTCIEAGVGDTLTEASMIADGILGKGTPLRLGNGYNRFICPISIPNPKIWDLDTPYLYQVQVQMVVDGEVTSTRSRQFGIRTFTQDVEGDPKGMFYLNGRKIKLRGANTMGYEQQDVMHGDFDQLVDDMLLAKLCNMNFLRLTQRPVQEEIYDYCDRLGLMIQTDLPMFGTMRINQVCEALRQVGEMEHLIRSHACCILATYINEPFPNAQNKPHRMVKRHDLMNFFESADHIIHLHNPERVIKHVDGDYDPPSVTLPDNHCYTMWYNGHGLDLGMLHKGYWLAVKPGWYYGCGEFGSEGLDFPETMRTYYPKHWIREPFHPSNITGAQTGNFHYFFYDTPETMEDWVVASHKHQAFATKTMTSAMRRNNSFVTFAIHLFIDAFPSNWMKTIMDFKRNPKPAYFVYRDCLTPLMADLRNDRRTFFAGETVKVESYICNDNAPVEGAEVCYMVLQGDKVLYSGKKPAVIGDCNIEFQGFVTFDAPQVTERTKLTLMMGIMKDGEVLHYTQEEYTVFPAMQGKMPKIVAWDEYEANKAAIDKSVEEGATVIIEPLTQGTYAVADRSVKVKNCGMHPVYFVSGNNGHPLTDGLQKGDFGYWYDSKVDRMSPVAFATFVTDNVETVLSGGNQDDNHDWQKVDVCGILPYGKGKIVLCQIDLNRADTNPVCAIFADRLANL